MSIASTLTPLMDKARKLTGLTEKISIARLTSLMNHFDLHVNPNLLDKTQITTKHTPNSPYQQWTYNNFDYVLKPYTTYTFSWRAKTDSDKSDKKIRVRIFDLQNNAVIANANGAGVEFPLTDQRQSYTFTVSDNINSYQVCLYGSGQNVKETWDVTFYDCKLEVGDLATPLNLLPNHEIRYLPKNNPANNFDCYAIYTDTSIKMEYGKKYEVIAETNGLFSNQHQPNVESNKCVLWLTDNNVYTQPISDEHTAQGTVFTWGGPTGTYYLRVNAYHNGTTNTIYAYNVRIYEV